MESLPGRMHHHAPLEGPDATMPLAHFLSNGHYTVLVTGAGSGFSSAGGCGLNRWTGDPVEESGGCFLYVRDLDNRAFWSAGHQPTQIHPELYRNCWKPGRIEIARRDDGIDTRVEICVPTDLTLEIRRITLTNTSTRIRRVELTSYTEIVLDRFDTYNLHPAFSKLSIQTEFIPELGALLAIRRPRSNEERHPILFHALLGKGGLQIETDRARFLGRGNSLATPRALTSNHPLSGTVGTVLDPIASLRRSVSLDPGESVRFLFLLGIAPTRREAFDWIRMWAPENEAERGFDRARTGAENGLERIGFSPERAEYFQSMAAGILYGYPSLRAASEILERCRGKRADLLRHGITPEIPYAVLHTENPAGAALLPDLRKAHRYWKSLGLPIALHLVGNISSSLLTNISRDENNPINWILRDEIPSEELDLIDAAARLVVTDSLPCITVSPPPPVNVGASAPPAPVRVDATDPAHIGKEPIGGREKEELRFFNGHGGFSKDGKEYVIRLMQNGTSRLDLPPLPWINIIANDRFGFLVSETGAGYTWSENSREHRLTPWSNDPVRDPHGEAIYIRDEETGEFWSPLAGPIPGNTDYEMRHGFGYSLCRHESHGLEQETLLFVPLLDPLKITRLSVSNRSGRLRRLSFISYRQLVLGDLPERSGPSVISGIDRETNTLFAHNPLADSFASNVAFAGTVPPDTMESLHFSCDRFGFLGPCGDPGRPAALRRRTSIEGRTGAGLNPCFAEQVVLELPPGESATCSFLFGEETNRENVHLLTDRYRAEGAIDKAFDEVLAEWQRIHSGLQIKTPVPALDLMVNGWLTYQTIVCRLRGRSALYQSGGAFGFRDQLQDASSLVYLDPGAMRKQILLHGAHQFVEGDVLHWWHPPLSRGIRTRFADDRLWLPYLTSFYIRSTGDRAILNENLPYLTSRAPAADEDELLVIPEKSGESEDLYHHCCRAIDISLNVGDHGLPLFGTGDWNDGMNRVGREGKGESVWMGFFLYEILGKFIPLAEDRSDAERVDRYRSMRDRLRTALNKGGWDGGWYKRGYYDDGTPLGSQENNECRIDALAQAWAVISGAAPGERAETALDAVEHHLVSEKDGLIRLLTPPFQNTSHDPGYIKGYVPGVRENGGQYTHAALWVVRALAELGRNDRAARLLEMLSPVSHTLTPEQVAVYRLEPYVVAADVYGEPPHVGRGGWSWYTGSSAWMYRVAIESVLGFRMENGNTLLFKPCVPNEWPCYAIQYRLPGEKTRFEITVENPTGRADSLIKAILDGIQVPIENGTVRIPLSHDEKTHIIRITLG